MRKIHITESQWEAIMEAEGYPLDLKADNGKPDNFTEYEVAVDNTDKDAPNDLTIADTISTKRSKEGWFGMNRYPAMHRLPESRELDTAQNSGFGLKADAFIDNVAANNSGKMVSNVSSEINSNKRGSLHNTNLKRLKRLEAQKVTNPELYAKNGGDKMVNILQNQTDQQASAHAAKHATDNKNENPNTQSAYKASESGAYYFK